MNQSIKFSLALFSIMLWQGFARAQNMTGIYPASSFLKGTNGSLLQDVKSEYETDGSPFYPDKYKESIFVLTDGKGYTGIKAKINLMENQLLFLSENGNEMIATSPVKIVIFRDPSDKNTADIIFEKGFPPIDQQTDASFYEVLDTGKVKLLKYHRVSYIDKKGYLTETVTRVFNESNDYYLFSDKKGISRIEKGKDFLVSYLGDKNGTVSKFIDTKNLKCKKESDWKTVIAFYNNSVKE